MEISGTTFRLLVSLGDAEAQHIQACDEQDKERSKGGPLEGRYFFRYFLHRGYLTSRAHPYASLARRIGWEHQNWGAPRAARVER
jgi:hypothetical protein